MKELQDYFEQWLERRRVKKHMDKILAVREEIARLTTVLQARSKIRFGYNSDIIKTGEMQGNLAALQVRLAHLEEISRKPNDNT